jgi:hypothetical protein
LERDFTKSATPVLSVTLTIARWIFFIFESPSRKCVTF